MLDTNGIWGGQGEGVKTILPRDEHAKISCRLVSDQDPERVIELLRAHAESHAPAGVTVEVVAASIGAKPYIILPTAGATGSRPLFSHSSMAGRLPGAARRKRPGVRGLPERAWSLHRRLRHEP